MDDKDKKEEGGVMAICGMTHLVRESIRGQLKQGMQTSPLTVRDLLDALDELDPPPEVANPDATVKVWIEFADLREKLAEALAHEHVARNRLAEARDRLDRLFEATKQALE